MSSYASKSPAVAGPEEDSGADLGSGLSPQESSPSLLQSLYGNSFLASTLPKDPGAVCSYSTPPPAAPVAGFVNTPWSCALRSAPRIETNNVKADLPAGTILKSLGTEGAWQHVIADVNGKDEEGYISGEIFLKQGEEGSIPMETVTKQVTDGPYGWTSRYDIWGVRKTVHVRLRIALTPGAGVTQTQIDQLRAEWELAEDKWSHQYKLVNGADSADSWDVVVDLQFVAANAHQTVNVNPGPARSNMTQWDTADDRHAASHESGHMLGQPDEYPDSTSPQRPVTDSSSVMHTNTGKVMSRHYQDFATWLGAKKGATYAVR